MQERVRAAEGDLWLQLASLLHSPAFAVSLAVLILLSERSKVQINLGLVENPPFHVPLPSLNGK